MYKKHLLLLALFGITGPFQREYSVQLSKKHADPGDRLLFNVMDFLDDKAPHLLRYGSRIDYWSKLCDVDPRVLITLMQQHSGIVYRPNQLHDLIKDAFGVLSKRPNFDLQVADIATRLRRRVDEYMLTGSIPADEKYKEEPLDFLFPQSYTEEDRRRVFKMQIFKSTYFDLFHSDYENNLEL